MVKVGLKAVQRDGLDYEFTLVFDVDIKHFAVSSKDRTGLFMGKPEFVINTYTGKRILEWCNQGSLPVASSSHTKLSENKLYQKIESCTSLSDLSVLYKEYPEYHNNLNHVFMEKKKLLSQLTNPQNFSTNGHSQNN